MIMDLIKLLIQPTATQENIKEEANEFIWKYVIVRGYDSGVHFGKLESYKKWEAILTDTRRLWYWKCKQGLWLSSVAQYWLHNDSKITCALAKIKIVDERISEIIPCTEESIKSIQEIKEYNPD